MMTNVSLALGRLIRLVPSLASAWLVSASASAQLTQYVAVNPIDVCALNGDGCAPINNMGQTFLNGQTTPVGIVDSSSQINITRATFNAIGIEVAFGPVVQYKSALNDAFANTDYRTLHVVNSTDSAGNPILQSPDFLILSQQQQDPPGPPGIWTGTVPNPTYPPDVPVALQPTVLNLFFVNRILPPNDGTAQLYGFGWEDNNGIAISMNTMLGVPFLGLPRRPDTIAHEFGHNFLLDHTTFGAGPDPSTGGCDTTPFTGCAVNLMTAGGNEAGDLRAEPTSTDDASSPSPGGALYALMAGTAEQLNATQQVPQVLLSNFIMNKLAESMTMASEMPSDSATAEVTSIGPNLTALSGSTADPKLKPNTSIFFNVTGPVPGTDRPGETLDGLILTLNKAVQFDPDNRVFFFPPNRTLVADVDYIRGSKRNPDCPDPATECLLISLSPGLPENQNLTFSQGIIRKSIYEHDASARDPGDYDEGKRNYDERKRDHDERKRPVTLTQLAAAGAFITSIFSDGLHIKSALTGPNASGQLTANSQNPIPTETSQIDLSKYTSPPADPANPSGPPLLPCTPVPINTGAARGAEDHYHHPPPLGCPNPSETGISDGDPSQEGGQPRGPSLR
jgi:hypothetical protein